MQASRLSAWKISCSPFSVNLFCSLQFPTMMSGPDLPGRSWRFVRTELTARRKAPLSYLPSGNEPSPPWPSRAQHLQSSSPLVFSVHSVSVLPWPFGCHVVPALLQVFQMYTDLKFARAFLSLYFCLRSGDGEVGAFLRWVVAF